MSDDEPEPILRTERLTMRFGGLAALNELDLDVREGDIHAIIGPNGAGKTTVFNCVMQNLRVSGGRIWFRGERLDGLTPDRVAEAGVSRTYQNIRLFRNITAIENLLVGMHLHLRSHWWGALKVDAKQIVTLIGANGAGKTTTVRAISGLIRPRSGDIRFDGESLAGIAPHAIAARGVLQVPEGRRIFARLTVAENLAMGAFPRRDVGVIAEDRERMLELFPRLKERLRQVAGTLSGGEQQMLATARALMGRPRVLLMDEPSMGLSPLMVDSVFETIRTINEQGVGSCSSSRTPSWRSTPPTTPMLWRAAASFCPVRAGRCSATRRCSVPISAEPTEAPCG
jgi:branched-chain amino acid transport system ATP-binding protein